MNAFTSRTVASIELELEILYEGLSKAEIQDRISADEDAILEAIRKGEAVRLTLPLKAFRFSNYGGGHHFPDLDDLEDFQVAEEAANQG